MLSRKVTSIINAPSHRPTELTFCITFSACVFFAHNLNLDHLLVQMFTDQQRHHSEELIRSSWSDAQSQWPLHQLSWIDEGGALLVSGWPTSCQGSRPAVWTVKGVRRYRWICIMISLTVLLLVKSIQNVVWGLGHRSLSMSRAYMWRHSRTN